MAGSCEPEPYSAEIDTSGGLCPGQTYSAVKDLSEPRPTGHPPMMYAMLCM
jgi:hypothetical protein